MPKASKKAFRARSNYWKLNNESVIENLAERVDITKNKQLPRQYDKAASGHRANDKKVPLIINEHMPFNPPVDLGRSHRLGPNKDK